MNASISSYFRACYQTDFRTISLLDFFGKNVSETHLLNSGKLISDQPWPMPVDSEWGATVAQQLAVYSKEKALTCAALFVVGRTTILGRKRKVCAPLYLYPTQLTEEKEIYYLQVDVDKPTINPAVLGFFQDTSSGRYEKLCDALPTGYLDFEAMHQIETVLKQHLPLLQQHQQLDDFPSVLDKEQVLAVQKKAMKKDQFVLLPALGMALINKPTGSRGIINELEEMSREAKFSRPIQTLFGNENFPQENKKMQRLAIPLMLSKAQEKVLQNAQRHDLSLVIGPPGTGKSFTIAAMALEAMSRGKSVLIAAKNMQAVQVVGQKIEQDFGLKNVVVKTGSKNYQRELKKRLQNWLNGIGARNIHYHEVKNLSLAIDRQSNLVRTALNRLLARESLELKRGDFLSADKPYFWNRWRKIWLAKQVGKQTPYWELMQSLEEKIQQQHQKVRQWIEASFQSHLYHTLRQHRKELKQLLKALQARTGNAKEAHFNEVDFSTVLQALPIWITDTGNIHSVLPLQKELFDLVIIDEATQCDIASALPILQRGKRAVVVGDPKQLRHLSFLSRVQQQQLVEQHQLGNLFGDLLNYRENSLLDVVAEYLPQQDQLQMLDEHFRSMPDLIEFSNREFYQERLRIMTASPSTLQKQHLFLVAQEGRREGSGANPIEAQKMLERIKEIIAGEEQLTPAWCQSIGILSPFRAQVDELQKQVESTFSHDAISRHHIMIGTPQSFQGEERDLMFLSLALDQDAHPSAFQYLNREDVFNVSITRARSQQFVYHSFPIETVKSQSLLGRYLGYVRSLQHPTSKPTSLNREDTFTKEVLSFLGQHGVQEKYIAYPIAGVEVDIVVVVNGKTFCIDLVGFPGAFEEALSIDRWEVLGRVGLQTFMLPYSWWIFEKVKTENDLLAFLQIPIAKKY